MIQIKTSCSPSVARFTSVNSPSWQTKNRYGTYMIQIKTSCSSSVNRGLISVNKRESENLPPVVEFIDPWLGDKVNSDKGLSYRPARLHVQAGRYDNRMPELTLSPQSGIYLNSATDLRELKGMVWTDINGIKLLTYIPTHPHHFRTVYKKHQIRRHWWHLIWENTIPKFFGMS